MAGEIPTYSLYGESIRENPDFWLHCETIASRSGRYRWEIGEHRHENFQQFLYIRDGSGDARLGSAMRVLSPPCVVVVPPGLRHGFRFSSDVDGLVLTFLANRLSRIAKSPTQPAVISLTGDDDGRFVAEIFDRLSSELNGHRPGRRDLVEACLTTIVVLLGRLATDGEDTAATPGADRVKALMDLVAQHYRRHLPVTAYARMLNLSPTHLNRLTREVAGMTVHDLINTRLIDEARRDLVFGTASVKTIADDLGFADAAYFSRTFARHTGMTPGLYRRAERQKLETAATG
ncbi:MAG: helix-turn-helix domain-containing protein [Neorhizobium sp.]|nr:helix-turn-helix domain-containing protein [Neorhizobium sp.]